MYGVRTSVSTRDALLTECEDGVDAAAAEIAKRRSAAARSKMVRDNRPRSIMVRSFGGRNDNAGGDTTDPTQISKEVDGHSSFKRAEENSMLITHFNRSAIDKYEQKFAEKHRFTGPALDKSLIQKSRGSPVAIEEAGDVDSDIEVEFSSDDDSGNEDDNADDNADDAEC